MSNSPPIAPQAGICEEMEPGVRRILARNPTPMTYWGTNTYLLGQHEIAVIDPGPEDSVHMQAILNALQPGQRITHILLTHSHLDHSPLARALSDQTGAAIYAFGTSSAGRSDVMQQFSDLGGGEGVDPDFAPDHLFEDGAVFFVGDIAVTAIWTPGHMGNHMCFRHKGMVFSGDHVMDWATSMVSPPDGDLTDFMASLRKLQHQADRVYYPAHGLPVTDPAKRVADLIAHRTMREGQILHALKHATGTPKELTARVYQDVSPALLPAAERNVLAHLIDLNARGVVVAAGGMSRDATFHLSP